MEFSRQESWSGWPFRSAGDLPHPGIEPVSPALQADSLPSEPSGKPMINHKGKEKFKKTYIYICITELLCCTVEIGTIL